MIHFWKARRPPCLYLDHCQTAVPCQTLRFVKKTMMGFCGWHNNLYLKHKVMLHPKLGGGGGAAFFLRHSVYRSLVNCCTSCKVEPLLNGHPWGMALLLLSTRYNNRPCVWSNFVLFNSELCSDNFFCNRNSVKSWLQKRVCLSSVELMIR